MEFKCTKVRKLVGSPHNDSEGDPVHVKIYEAQLEAVEQLHTEKGSISNLRIQFWNSCPYEQGHVYVINI